MKIFVAAVLALLVVAQPLHAAPRATGKVSCRTTLDAARLGNVLFKNENVHGGRGRTFLDQGHRFGGTRRLTVAGTNGTPYACFGLWACDHPYGCRYYQRLCGDGLSNSGFAAGARKNGGSTTALVTNGSGLCIKINAAASRYGSVH